MNYVEWVEKTKDEPDSGTYWIDITNGDLWILTDIGPSGVMVRVKDGKFCSLVQGRTDGFRRFHGNITINTEAA